MDELDRAGTVDERITVFHEGRCGDRVLNAHLMMAGFLAGIPDRGAGLNGSLPLHGARPREDRFK
jgi:hypothetical protein